MLDGVPLGQLGIEGINNNNTQPLTVLAAVIFTPDLPPADTNSTGHRPRAHSLDFAPMLPSCSHRMRGGVAFGHWMTFSNSQVSPTTTGHIQEGKRAEGRTTRYNRSSYHHCPHLHLLPSPLLDAGKYTVPPQVGNLDRQPHTIPFNRRLRLESGRDVNPTGRDPLNQEENIRRLSPKPSERGVTPH